MPVLNQSTFLKACYISFTFLKGCGISFIPVHYKWHAHCSKFTELFRYYTTAMALKLFWIPFNLGQIKEICTHNRKVLLKGPCNLVDSMVYNQLKNYSRKKRESIKRCTTQRELIGMMPWRGTNWKAWCVCQWGISCQCLWAFQSQSCHRELSKSNQHPLRQKSHFHCVSSFNTFPKHALHSVFREKKHLDHALPLGGWAT